jgi:hypothetical protein
MADEAAPIDAKDTEGHVAPAVTHPSADNITGDKTADNALPSLLDEAEGDAGESGDGNKRETPAGEKDGEGSEAGDDDKPEGAPETYEAFAVPEGVTLDEAVIAEAVPVFKDLGLKQDQAQKLVDFWTARATAAEEANARALTDFNAKLIEQVKADPELGGAALKQNLALASKAIERFGSPQLKTLLAETGFGNQPEVLRFLKKVGEIDAEDTLERGRSTPAPSARGDLTGIYKTEIMEGT